jgi:hypothetical protein
VVERTGERVMLGAGGGKGRSGGGERAFGGVAAVGGGGSPLLRLDAPRVRIGKRLGRGLGAALCLVASRGLLAAIAERFELLGEARPLLLGARQLGVGGLQRGLGDPALGAHRRLAGKQFGKRRLGIARNGLELAQLGSDPRGDGFGVDEPPVDRAPLFFELGDRARRVALQRFLAGDVAGE